MDVRERQLRAAENAPLTNGVFSQANDVNLCGVHEHITVTPGQG